MTTRTLSLLRFVGATSVLLLALAPPAAGQANFIIPDTTGVAGSSVTIDVTLNTFDDLAGFNVEIVPCRSAAGSSLTLTEALFANGEPGQLEHLTVFDPGNQDPTNPTTPAFVFTDTFPECLAVTTSCVQIPCVPPVLTPVACTEVHDFVNLEDCGGQSPGAPPLIGGSAEFSVVVSIAMGDVVVLPIGQHLVARLTYLIPATAQLGEEFAISVRQGSGQAIPTTVLPNIPSGSSTRSICCDPANNSGSITVVGGCTAPEALTCTPDLGGIRLDWSNPQDFTFLEVQRNGTVIATLPNGNETTFLDTTPELGTQSYVVVGQCPDPPGGGPQASAECLVDVLRLSCDDNVLASGGSTTIPIRFQHTSQQVTAVQFGLLHDSTRLIPTGMLDPGDVTFPPMTGFEILSLFPNESNPVGVTYVAIFDEFDPMMVPVTGPGPRVVEIEYQVVNGAPSGPTPITFTDTLGSPFPIAPELTLIDPLTGGISSVTPITDDGSVIIGGKFIRGDCNQDNAITLADAITCLQLLFTPGVIADPMCDDQQDVDDNGVRSISDAIALLNYLFGGAGDLTAPFPPTIPATCDIDPTPDSLECTVDPSYCP